MQPPPDTKDWTWTLTRRCDQCGLSAGEIDPAQFAERAFVAAEEWVQILRSSPAVSARPQPDVWSPLEYGVHVRDVYRLFDARLAQMLSEDTPTFTSWDQDETAIAERYSEQDPEVVGAIAWPSSALPSRLPRGAPATGFPRTCTRSAYSLRHFRP